MKTFLKIDAFVQFLFILIGIAGFYSFSFFGFSPEDYTETYIVYSLWTIISVGIVEVRFPKNPRFKVFIIVITYILLGGLVVFIWRELGLLFLLFFVWIIPTAAAVNFAFTLKSIAEYDGLNYYKSDEQVLDAFEILDNE